MIIEVILPVVQYDLAVALLKQIDGNSRAPHRVILIDNTNEVHTWPLQTNSILEIYYSQSKRLNESWEIGRSKLHRDCDIVMFLNDDIIIPSWFFQRIFETFEVILDCGIACPRIVDSANDIQKGKPRYEVQRKRMMNACAFGIKKNILDEIPTIPYERVTTFYGDNWIWAHTRKMGYCWGMDIGNPVYHYVGKSILQLGFRSLKGVERNEWEKIRKETWGK